MRGLNFKKTKKKARSNLNLRFNVLTVFTYIIGIVLIIQLFNLQIVHGAEYREESNTRLTRESTLEAARGEILDRTGTALVTNSTKFSVELYKTKIDDNELNTSILNIVNLLEKYQVEYEDSFPISIEPFQYTISDEKLANWKKTYELDENTSAEEAFYDFNKAMGNGEKDVYAKGDWGELWAEGFAYHQDKEILILKGKSKLKNEEQTLTADKELRYYRLENRVEADNNVHLQDKESKLRSDFLKAYLREGGKLEFEHMEALGSVKIINADNTMYADKAKAYFEGSDISQMQAEGHVKVVNKQNTLTADRATADFIKGEISKVRAYDKVKVIDDKNTLYADKATAFLQGRDITKIEANDNVKIIDKDRDMQADRMVAYFAAGSKGKIEKIEAFGNVKIVTPDGFVQGEYGIYTPLQDEVEIHKNVVISKDGSVIKGDKAVTNLETSVSRVYMDSANKRVSGVITGSTIKGGTDEKEQ